MPCGSLQPRLILWLPAARGLRHKRIQGAREWEKGAHPPLARV